MPLRLLNRSFIYTEFERNAHVLRILYLMFNDFVIKGSKHAQKKIDVSVLAATKQKQYV